MQPPAEQQPTRVLSYRVLALVVLGGMGIAFCLIPSQRELLNRVRKDRLCATITPVLAEGRFSDGRTPTQALRELPAERLAALAELVRLSPRDQLRQIFDPGKTQRYDAFTHAFVLAAIRFVAAMPPADALKIIVPASSTIPDDERVEIFQLIATNALATSRPDVAAEALRQACRSSASEWRTVQDMVSASRWAGHNSVAIDSVRAWMARWESRLDPAQKSEAFNLSYSLALEAGLPGAALDACLDNLKRQQAITQESEGLMESAHRAAVLAERSKDILPWVESYLSSFPEARLSWQEILKSIELDPSSHASYKKWVKRAAEIADWNLLPEKAYAHHQRLLAMLDFSALDRFLPLSSHLGRGEETADLLEAISPYAGTESLRIHTARLVAANGKIEDAALMFEEWIKGHPDDRKAAFELACLREATADTATAIAAFEKVVRAFPGDPAAIKRIVSLRIRQGQPEAALRELDNLNESDFDPDTRENYTMLAESLDRPESLQRALGFLSRNPKETTPELYLRMAEVARQYSDEGKPLAILREGISKMPASPSLRIEYATLLLDQERFDEALTEMLHPVVKGRMDAISLALAASIHTSRVGEALAAVGKDLEKKNDLPITTRLDLAVACTLNGEAPRGERIFASVPEERLNLARLSEARLFSGQLTEAERLAKKNIAQVAAPQPSDWILLGDTQSRQGRAEEANAAYAKALAVVSQRITRKHTPSPLSQTADEPKPVTRR
jgi:tetratricopeptide (TPR) repeat protein